MHAHPQIRTHTYRHAQAHSYSRSPCVCVSRETTAEPADGRWGEGHVAAHLTALGNALQGRQVRRPRLRRHKVTRPEQQHAVLRSAGPPSQALPRWDRGRSLGDVSLTFILVVDCGRLVSFRRMIPFFQCTGLFKTSSLLHVFDCGEVASLVLWSVSLTAPNVNIRFQRVNAVVFRVDVIVQFNFKFSFLYNKASSL